MLARHYHGLGFTAAAWLVFSCFPQMSPTRIVEHMYLGFRLSTRQDKRVHITNQLRRRRRRDCKSAGFWSTLTYVHRLNAWWAAFLHWTGFALFVLHWCRKSGKQVLLNSPQRHLYPTKKNLATESLFTYSLHCSSFSWLSCRILNMKVSPQKGTEFNQTRGTTRENFWAGHGALIIRARF